MRKIPIPEYSEQVKLLDISINEADFSIDEFEEVLISCPNTNELWFFLSSQPLSKGRIANVLQRIVKYGKNIEVLRIQSHLLLDEDLSIINQRELTKLTEMDLSRCGRISAKGVENMAVLCPKLTSLSLSYSLYTDKNAPDEAAVYIGKHLPFLKQLNMHRCCHLTDVGMGMIARGCKNLETIEVGRNYELTDESLKEIGENCKELSKLGMYYNRKITEKGLKYIMSGCPKFKEFSDGNGWGAIANLQEIKSKYPQIRFS